MNPESFQLTIEQSFELEKIMRNVDSLSPEHLRDLAIQMARLIMVKDNMIKSLIKQGVTL